MGSRAWRGHLAPCELSAPQPRPSALSRACWALLPLLSPSSCPLPQPQRLLQPHLPAFLPLPQGPGLERLLWPLGLSQQMPLLVRPCSARSAPSSPQALCCSSPRSGPSQLGGLTLLPFVCQTVAVSGSQDEPRVYHFQAAASFGEDTLQPRQPIPTKPTDLEVTPGLTLCGWPDFKAWAPTVESVAKDVARPNPKAPLPGSPP